jgi:hypothetical protein
VEAANAEDALYGSRAKAGNAQQRFFLARIYIDGEEFAIPKRPRELGIHVEWKVGRVGCCDFLDGKAVEANEPVGLIEAMLAHKRGGFHRKRGRRVRYG